MYRVNGRNQETGKLILERRRDPQEMTQSSASSGDRREFLDMLLDWNRDFADHHLSSTLRYTQDVKRQTVNVGADIKNSVAFRNLNLAGQVNYNWKYRYFVGFNFGYSGSENFADGNRFGFFPSFSMAWNVAEESFIKNNMTWLSMFKVRYSQGKVGNDKLYLGGALQRFPYLYTINTDAGGYNFGFGENSDKVTGINYSQVASMGVTWEVATKKDLGFDLSILNDKFSLTMDYFNEKRTGIYVVRNFLPEIAGLTSAPRANVGAVRTEGFDGNFHFKHKVGNVDMTIRGNITYTKNEILERDEVWQVYPYLYQKGYRVDQRKGLVALGLFKDYDDIRNSPTQTFGTVQPGDIKYADVSGDGIVNGDDRVAIGATTRPNLGYGVGMSFMWNGFDFNFHFQGAGRSTFPIYGKCVFAFSDNAWGNIFSNMLDGRYIDADTANILGLKPNENPNASYPRLTYGVNGNNDEDSTFWMRDGKYIRLKNVDIGYSLPKRIANKVYLSNLRIFVSAANLYTWAPFNMWDPESAQPRGEDYPLTRSVTLGISINL
jgi:TonB-linked SusC/RagA family outer membrane protein